MKRICLHHVGGRAGNRSFPILSKFEKDIINVLYDADQDCIKQIEYRNRILRSELHVLPYCVGGKTEKDVDFHINYDPYSSSVMEMNKKYANWYFYFRNGRYDYIVEDTLKTVETRKQQMFTLDDICNIHEEILPPDVLSLDAQGVEYDIIKGSPRVIHSNVLAVVTEVEFHQMYASQRLFGDISALMTQSGFEFVKFTKDFAEYCPYRKPIGLRGDGFHYVGEALFFRSIDDLIKVEDSARRQTMLDKLAFIAIVYSQIEFAVECLERSMECRGLAPSANNESDCAYIQFLREIENEIKVFESSYPPKFSDLYTFEQSRSRFNANSGFSLEGKKSIGAAAAIQRSITDFEDSGIENILRKYDLGDQADLIKKNRVKQSSVG